MAGDAIGAGAPCFIVGATAASTWMTLAAAAAERERRRAALVDALDAARATMPGRTASATRRDIAGTAPICVDGTVVLARGAEV